MLASVSPSRASGSLLQSLVGADLTFPHCPSAQSTEHLSQSSPVCNKYSNPETIVQYPRDDLRNEILTR
jgi:hypothetical protein